MRKLVIVDVSNIAYMSLHSVESGADNGGAWTTPDIESEFTKRFALSLYSTVKEHKGDTTVFAMDKKLNGRYWRDDVLDAWNASHIQYFMAGDRFVQRRNGLDYFADNSKVTKKWLKETKTELLECDEIEIPSETMLQFLVNIDGYKGSRARRVWNHELDSGTFAKLIGGVANYVASLVPNVKVVRVAGYEADDIAATLALIPNARQLHKDIVLVTKDSDWQQLCRNESVKFFSLNSKDKELIGFVNVTPTEALNDLTEKILLGDTSDTIPPCLTANGERITPTKIHKLEATEETYNRNKTLIELNFDQHLLDGIHHYTENVWQPVLDASWSSIRVSQTELDAVEFNASLNSVFNAWNAGFVIPLNDA